MDNSFWGTEGPVLSSNVSRGMRHLGKHVFRLSVPALENVILLSYGTVNGAVSSGL